MAGTLEKWWGLGGGGGLETWKLCNRNCPNKIPEKKNLKKKEIFHMMGQILILNQCSISLVPLVLGKN